MNTPVLPDSFLAARRWFAVGTAALALAGLFALLMLSSKSFFHKGLVVHVDLSVLVWFLAVAGMIWRLYSRPSLPATAALLCFALGMLCLPLAALFPIGEGLMNNYVPMIIHPLFHLGLALLLCGVALAAGNLLYSFFAHQVAAPDALHDCFKWPASMFAVTSSTCITLVSMAAFFLVYSHIPASITGIQFYEMLFWAGGHILQFAHTQLVMILWLWLATIAGLRVRLSQQMLIFLFSVGATFALIGFYYAAVLDPTSDRYQSIYTVLMRDGNAIAPLIIVLAVFQAMVCGPLEWAQGNTAPLLSH